jgi:hypothetical protein
VLVVLSIAVANRQGFAVQESTVDVNELVDKMAYTTVIRAGHSRRGGKLEVAKFRKANPSSYTVRSGVLGQTLRLV